MTRYGHLFDKTRRNGTRRNSFSASIPTPMENTTNVYSIYLGPECPVLLCAVVHMPESSQIVKADDHHLQTDMLRNEESAGGLFIQNFCTNNHKMSQSSFLSLTVE